MMKVSSRRLWVCNWRIVTLPSRMFPWKYQQQQEKLGNPWVSQISFCNIFRERGNWSNWGTSQLEYSGFGIFQHALVNSRLYQLSQEWELKWKKGISYWIWQANYLIQCWYWWGLHCVFSSDICQIFGDIIHQGAYQIYNWS